MLASRHAGRNSYSVSPEELDLPFSLSSADCIQAAVHGHTYTGFAIIAFGSGHRDANIKNRDQELGSSRTCIVPHAELCRAHFSNKRFACFFAPSVLAGALDCQLQGRYQPLPLFLSDIFVAVAKGPSEK